MADPPDSEAPAAVLVKDDNSERWTIELRNFPKVREALGADVMNAFCRCFIHADRLTSMITFAYTSEKHFGRDSIAFGRDLHNMMVWFTTGTLRELARATKDCRAALAKRKLLDADSPPWLKLRNLEDRWERDETFYQDAQQSVPRRRRRHRSRARNDRRRAHPHGAFSR